MVKGITSQTLLENLTPVACVHVHAELLVHVDGIVKMVAME